MVKVWKSEQERKEFYIRYATDESFREAHDKRVKAVREMTKYNIQPFSAFGDAGAQLTEGMPIEDEPIVVVDPLPFDELPSDNVSDLPEWFWEDMRRVYDIPDHK
jgi:hypothetical protein